MSDQGPGLIKISLCGHETTKYYVCDDRVSCVDAKRECDAPRRRCDLQTGWAVRLAVTPYQRRIGAHAYDDRPAVAFPHSLSAPCRRLCRPAGRLRFDLLVSARPAKLWFSFNCARDDGLVFGSKEKKPLGYKRVEWRAKTRRDFRETQSISTAVP